MKEFKSITVEFEDHNQLCLEKVNMRVHGFKPNQEVFGLYHLEVEIDKDHCEVYNTNNIEYFPLNMLNTALSAFNRRFTSKNPFNESGMGVPLTEFLEKE